MKISYDAPIAGMRGMAGGRKQSSHGCSIRLHGSQTLNTRTRRTGRVSDAERAGQLAMQVMMHAFSLLSVEQRASWAALRRQVREEWQTNTEWGPEQYHPGDITYSDLDLYIACNHHRALAGVPLISTAARLGGRPSLTITRMVYYPGAPQFIRLDLEADLAQHRDTYCYAQVGQRHASAQRRWRDCDYMGISTEAAKNWKQVGPNDLYLQYSYASVDISEPGYYGCRLLLFSRGQTPYGYTSWRGIPTAET